MKKIFKDYLKKVQKLQQMLLGDRTMYVEIFHHVYDDGDIINSISVDIKDDKEDFHMFGFSDNMTEKECAANYDKVCAFLRELGCNV